MFAAFLATATAATAQQPAPRIGYIYPAGGKQGTTFEAIIAGQAMDGVANIYFSGTGVQAAISELIRPTPQKELNEMRIKLDELLARKAVVQNDFKALEALRSLKNAKNVKDSKDAKDAGANDDKEIEALKKKYANASWTAEDDKTLAELRKKIGMAVRRPANPAISELAVLQVTIAPDAEPGQREVRIASPAGLSNPLAFRVGQLPEFSEKPSRNIAEQRSAVARAAFEPKTRKAEPETVITLPAIVNGQILPGEVDRYRFSARKGQHLVIVAAARELIPYIPDAVPGWFQATLALYDSAGKELAYDDDFRFNPDPVLYYEIARDGEYVIEIKDAIYRGREDFLYRITVGELPFVTGIFPLGGPAGARTAVALKGWNLPVNQLMPQARQPGVHLVSVGAAAMVSNKVPFAADTLPECLEKEPNDTPDRAQPVTLPIIVNGRIDKADDCDVFRFEGRAGSEVVAEVDARRLNSPLDSVLKLTDAAGKQLAFNDDHEDKGAGLTTHQADSCIRFKLPADGTYYVHLGDAQHKGGQDYAYRLRISLPQPDFELRVVPSSINVRGGAAIPVTVYALRRDGFSGDIAISLKDAPAGFTLGGACVPSGQDQVRVTLTAPATPTQEPLSLSWEGRATIQGKEVVRQAVPAEDMMQAFAYRHLVPAQDMKVAVSGRNMAKSQIKIAGDTPVKIPVGGTAKVQFTAPLLAYAKQVHLELSDPPDGITIKSIAPCPGGTEVVLQSDAAKTKAGLKGNLIVNAFFTPAAPAAEKGKAPAPQRRAAVGSLPAIPFEIVTP
ncbi:MAG: PPC domain-containing protein [Planctomycetota bacterium]|nr:PPC domain-containing protein [Planctomycetota bacterium]